MRNPETMYNKMVSSIGLFFLAATMSASAALVNKPPPTAQPDAMDPGRHVELIDPLLQGGGDEHDVVTQRREIEQAGVKVPSIGDRVARHIVNLPVFRNLLFNESEGTLYGGERLLKDGEEGRVYVSKDGKSFVLDLSALAWIIAGLIVVPVLIGILVSRLRAAKLRALRLRQAQQTARSHAVNRRHKPKRHAGSSRRRKAGVRQSAQQEPVR